MRSLSKLSVGRSEETDLVTHPVSWPSEVVDDGGQHASTRERVSRQRGLVAVAPFAANATIKTKRTINVSSPVS